MEKSLRRKRFENVAGKRVQAIIEKITILGNCSNNNNYDYNEQDIKIQPTMLHPAESRQEILHGPKGRSIDTFAIDVRRFALEGGFRREQPLGPSETVMGAQKHPKELGQWISEGGGRVLHTRGRGGITAIPGPGFRHLAAD